VPCAHESQRLPVAAKNVCATPLVRLACVVVTRFKQPLPTLGEAHR
jgi:hypothetical protein